MWPKEGGKFSPKGPKVADPKTHGESGAGLGADAGGQKSRAPTRPPSFPSSSPPFRALDEMCVQVTADLQPCSTVFQKANQCRRHANQRRESAAASGPIVVAGKSPRKAGQTPTSIRQRAGTVAPALGEPWRRHPCQRKVAQRKLLSPATGEKGRQLSTSWRVCVCVCVPRALTRLNRLAGDEAIWTTVRTPGEPGQAVSIPVPPTVRTSHKEHESNFATHKNQSSGLRSLHLAPMEACRHINYQYTCSSEKYLDGT